MNQIEISGKAAACIRACQEAAIAAERCAHACLHESGIDHLRRCIALDLDCAEVCRTTVYLLAHGSPLAREMCQVCLHACELAAAECRKHTHGHCQESAKACERAAQECRRHIELAQPQSAAA